MIKINNTSLESPDYVVTDIGEVQVAKKRIANEGNIYGANGKYIIHDEGYESSERIIKISVSDFDKVTYLEKTLKNFENVIEFDYLKNSKFFADLVDIKYAKNGLHRWLVSIKLIFYPFRYSLDSGLTILTNKGTVNNIGAVFSEPIIEIEGDGEVSLTIGSQTMVLKLDEKARIDCRHLKQNIYDKNNNVKNSIRVRGAFFEIQPGVNGVTTSGNVTNIKIHGNWRWRM